MSAAAAQALAALMVEARGKAGLEMFFASVMDVTDPTVMVQPDDSESVQLGPIVVVGTPAADIVVGDRVLCLRAASGALACLGKVLGSAGPPPAPILTATAGDARVDLSWVDGPTATSHQVFRSLTSGGARTELASGISGTAYTDTTAVNGTTYFYVVVAYTDTSGPSPDSNEASATPEFGPPSFTLQGAASGGLLHDESRFLCSPGFVGDGEVTIVFVVVKDTRPGQSIASVNNETGANGSLGTGGTAWTELFCVNDFNHLCFGAWWHRKAVDEGYHNIMATIGMAQASDPFAPTTSYEMLSHRISGVKDGDPFEPTVAVLSESPGGTAVHLPALTTTLPNALVIAAIAGLGSSGPPGPYVDGWTGDTPPLAEYWGPTGDSLPGDPSLVIVNGALAEPGDTGARDATATQAIAHTISATLAVYGP